MNKYLQYIIVFLILINGFTGIAQNPKIDSLLNVLNDSNYSSKAEILNKLAFAFDYIDREKSIEYANKALASANNESNKTEMALAYRIIGSYYEYKNKIEQAFENYYQALIWYQAINDFKGEAQLINLLGILHGRSSQYDSALVYFTKAYNIANEIQDSLSLTMVYMNLGLVYYHWSEYEEALKYLELSKEINIALNLKEGLGRSYHNLGKVAFKWTKSELALDYYRKAYSIIAELGDHKSLANLCIELGNVHARIEDRDSSIFYYQKAYSTAKELDATRIMSIALGNIGNRYEDSLDYKTAFEYEYKSYELIKNTNDRKRMAERLQSLGDLFRLTGQIDSAKIYIEKSLKISEEIKYKDQINVCYRSFYYLYRKIGDSKLALKYYILYAELYNSMFNEKSGKELAKFEAKYNSEKQASKIKILEKEKEINSLELKKQKQQKSFFIILAGLLIFVGLLLFNRYKLRQNNYRNKMELKTQTVEHRLLRSQMNPHFIFNSLNAIQSFISENDSETASRFLGKFASLIRHNLNSTRSAFVPLDQEVKALEINLELEKTRFNNCFNFVIDIDKEIDETAVQIPPLLVQPFVENAIIHGLALIKSDGLIELIFRKKEKAIEVTITDNGIGRKKSSELKNNSQMLKKSIGLQLIKERLELLNHHGKENNSFNIIDLLDKQGQAIGTKVVLSIPYETIY
ncbi:MAG: tetratricopeptide repeat protein [Bacteroidota bacterium]|nr:tetratricopeptide repeat protein [Bacteroidota bacterium]